ncbi:MAG: hypothetical protein ACLT98_04320 [Eggerthellaceae bacterium]
MRHLVVGGGFSGGGRGAGGRERRQGAVDRGQSALGSNSTGVSARTRTACPNSGEATLGEMVRYEADARLTR